MVINWLSLSVNGTVLSSITAAIETPTVFETLGFIKISATVGNARLILKDTDQVGILVIMCVIHYICCVFQ